LYLKNIII